MTVLYRKWRPQTLADVVGQEPVTRTLLNALSASTVSHAYLFCGPRGTGKTSTGRILAKALNCTTNQGRGEPCNTCSMCQGITEGRAFDVIEIDAASNRSIEDIRQLRERVGYAPNLARFKVYIIDEVHMLSKDACNALLKTLEEPPPHVIFILATTEAHKLLPTIISRCQRFDFRRISQADVIRKLGEIAAGEGIRVQPETLRLIARASTGSLRDAENLLQQLITFYGSEITLAQAQATLGMTGDARARQMIKHILTNDVAGGIATINSVDRDGLDLRHLNRELVEYLRALLLIKVGSKDAVDLTAEDKAELEKLAAAASLPQILRAVKSFGELEVRLDGNSTLPMELALVDCVLQDTAPQPRAEKVPTAPARTDRRAAVQPKAAPPQAKPEPEKPVASVEQKPVDAPKTPESDRAQVQPVVPELAAPAAAPVSELERLRQKNWSQLAKELPQRIPNSSYVGALINQALIKSVDDDIVTLSFEHEIWQQNMNKPENKKVAEGLLGSVLHRVCRVTTVHEPKAKKEHLAEAVRRAGGLEIKPEEK